MSTFNETEDKYIIESMHGKFYRSVHLRMHNISKVWYMWEFDSFGNCINRTEVM